jgi:hypothetical protein
LPTRSANLPATPRPSADPTLPEAHERLGDRNGSSARANASAIRRAPRERGIGERRTAGTYDYFVCPGHHRDGACRQGYHRADLVEAAVERHYATIQLSEQRRQRIAEAVRAHLGTVTGMTDTEIARERRELSRLDRPRAQAA